MLDAPVVIEAPAPGPTAADVALAVLALGAAATLAALGWPALARRFGSGNSTDAEHPERMRVSRRDRRRARALRKRAYFRKLYAATRPARSSGSRERCRQRTWRRRNPGFGKGSK